MSAASRPRLIPVVMVAAGALLALKSIGLLTNTSYLFVPPAQAASTKEEPKPADEHGAAGGEATAAKPAPIEIKPWGEKVVPQPQVSDSEKALLEALQKRREGLEARASDLELRENLLKATEKRLEERLIELKRIEQAVSEVDAKRLEEEKARLKDLVIMYETMKVKEAAAIFDKLDQRVLLDVASNMKPQKLSEILGKMSPEAAQKLTIALARRDVGVPKPMAIVSGELPKIEGRPAK